jgi:proline iminopeptidase
MTNSKGYAKVLGYNLYFRSFGDENKKGTVLCLHGGPGATHDYLLPLVDLTNYGYRVVMYDQLGCGRSDLPKNPALFTVERAVEDLEGFRRALRLRKVNLMGSSWGGMLAIAYTLKHQKNVRSLITTGGLASVPLANAEMGRLKSELPKDIQQTMERYEKRGEYEKPEYVRAVMVFYGRHLCRLDPWPKELKHSMKHMSKPVYFTMNGPNEFTFIGNIRYWDVTNRLPEIRVPTLVTGGRYDEVTPTVAKSIHRDIGGSELVTFESSSHLPRWEEREKYIDVLKRFLDKVGRS